MVLLSGMMRMAAITGRTDTIDTWLAGRQGGRWAQQTVAGAFPTRGPHGRRPPAAGARRPPADPAESLRELTALHEQGVVTDAELAALRARIGV